MEEILRIDGVLLYSVLPNTTSTVEEILPECSCTLYEYDKWTVEEILPRCLVHGAKLRRAKKTNFDY